MDIPSLLGDGQGNYRVHVVGNSGTGKSTISAYIATKLNVPHISLDALFWGPGWATPSDDEFKERVSAALTQNSKGWVIDGNGGQCGTLIPDHATDVIWLDPPLWFYLPRIFWRTLLRLLNIIPTCAEGCNETWGDVLSTNGIIWYCISRHGYCKHRFGEMLARTSITKGGNMRRLNEWDGDLRTWKAGLEEMLRTH
ncbi:AAA domain-containing protein [Suillus subalutaceus]|uniref:AAA domain-containing protein n=1 Tax=Suillus subalutaceus TaxID=48586 RepID=UPI001B85DDA9|nr:AAA domain-containing protein [Suillus subalutaceus]KAG1870742.1 AAA domain-containing protein [Suillus subalutaceus]